MKPENMRTRLKEVLHAQRFAVLATAQAGMPYANLIAFAVTPDLTTILFATPRNTRKCANLLSEPRVALLVDNRANTDNDLQAAVAVTILGQAAELKDPEREAGVHLYVARHPGLREFIQDPATLLFKVQVERYVLVDHFQHVLELKMQTDGTRMT